MSDKVRDVFDDLLTEGEVADIRRQSTSQIRRERVLGHGPPYLKLGRSVRYRRADLIQWLESCRVRPGEQAEADDAADGE